MGEFALAHLQVLSISFPMFTIDHKIFQENIFALIQSQKVKLAVIPP